MLNLVPKSFPFRFSFDICQSYGCSEMICCRFVEAFKFLLKISAFHYYFCRLNYLFRCDSVMKGKTIIFSSIFKSKNEIKYQAVLSQELNEKRGARCLLKFRPYSSRCKRIFTHEKQTNK